MERTQGLNEFIKTKEYRQALKLPTEVTEEYHMLAQGEYNRNYWFIHPVTGQKLILRINFGSQMHLEHQIEYEYDALKLLESSGRTPHVYYVDGSRNVLPYGVMVMEFLPGYTLDYETEIFSAVDCLAEIHCTTVPESNTLLSPGNPLKAILEECEEMFSVYQTSSLGKDKTKRKIRSLLDAGWKRVDDFQAVPPISCINTELNSTNFLVEDLPSGEKFCRLVDWEKPLYGDPAQDLGHFLAPTTTFWKTDIILDKTQTDEFVDRYLTAVSGRIPTEGFKERVDTYLPVTCLRGITWCSMAWVEYQQPGKDITNASTAKKLEEYLKEEFLDRIEEFSRV